MSERKIKDVRDVWACQAAREENKENPRLPPLDDRSKHKYKTLERHLSMKKTIRRKMMRDLREIGDATTAEESPHTETTGFLEQIKNDQPPPPNIDKPSLWKRLTKGWTH